MKTRVKLFVGLALVAAALCVTAQEAAVSPTTLIVTDNMDPYNVVLSDEDTGFLQSCTEVRIYGVEQDQDVRTSPTPAFVRIRAESRTELLLQPGRYELAIWMFYLPSEVHFLYFSVPDSGVGLVDLMTVEFPQELVTY
ncbi:MAG: hypothetical protein NTX23_09370 [Candidatus Bipolaricaulota bacterium]|nr:hypothetical protein [Candidatus Bipolaricaulota bacterium]